MKTFGVRICIVLCQFQRILAQMPHIDSQYNFRPVQMPNNMFRTSIVNDSLSSRIECATWCLLNAGYKNDCTAFYHKKGQNTRCECGDPYCYDKAKGMDISEIQPHINIKCKRPPLPPGKYYIY